MQGGDNSRDQATTLTRQGRNFLLRVMASLTTGVQVVFTELWGKINAVLTAHDSEQGTDV